jgi:hypothetical protein
MAKRNGGCASDWTRLLTPGILASGATGFIVGSLVERDLRNGGRCAV